MEKYNEKEFSSSFAPLSAFAYFGYQILFSIPVIGVICLIVCALFAGNRNLRNFARSYFCKYIVIAIVVLLLFTIGSSFLAYALNYILEFLNTLGVA